MTLSSIGQNGRGRRQSDRWSSDTRASSSSSSLRHWSIQSASQKQQQRGFCDPTSGERCGDEMDTDSNYSSSASSVSSSEFDDDDEVLERIIRQTYNRYHSHFDSSNDLWRYLKDLGLDVSTREVQLYLKRMFKMWGRKPPKDFLQGTHGVKKNIFVTILSLFLDLIGFTLILPLFPSILKYYKGNDLSGWYNDFSQLSNTLGYWLGAPQQQSEHVLMGGILGSLFCLLQFISAPIFGAFSDTYGRKPALCLCLMGIIASHIIWIKSVTFPIFILSRVVGGLFRANVSICTTIVSDDCPKEYRPKGMAMIGIAFSFGFVIGPLIGAYFAKSNDFIIPGYISLYSSVASLVLVIFLMSETLPGKSAIVVPERTIRLKHLLWPPDLFAFRSVSVGSQLRPLGTVYFIYIFIYSGLEFTLTFLAQTKFGYGHREQGMMFTVLGVCMAMFQGSLTRRIQVEHECAMGKIGMLFMVPAFLILGLCQEVYSFYFGLLCYSLGSAIVGPMLTSLLSSKVPVISERGKALGTFRSLGALARSFGPIIASTIFWRFGPEVSYGVGAIAVLIPLLLLRRINESQETVRVKSE